jgi:hypothetical protein
MHETPVAESDANIPDLASGSESKVRDYTATSFLVPALILLTIAAFANSLSGDFVYDDRPQIVNNQLFGHWDGATLKRVFTRDVWAVVKPDVSGEPVNSLYYRPVFTLFMMAVNVVAGLSPARWHVVVLLIHLLAVIGVYFVIEKSLSMATRTSHPHHRLMAGFAAAVFAVHPVQSQAVSWVCGVVAPLSAIFVLGSFYCFLVYRERGELKFLVVSMMLFGLAALTKESALVLPLIVVAYEIWVLAKEAKPGVRELAMRMAPFGIVVIVYLAMRYNALHMLFGRNPNLNFPEDASLTLMDNLRTLPALLMMYIKLLVLPVNLSIIYDFGYVRSLGLTSFWLPLTALLVIGILCVRLWKNVEARLALIWLVIPMLIVLNTRAFVSEEIVQDRYLYLSLPGVGLLAALLLTGVKDFARFRVTGQQIAGFAVLVVCVLAALTAMQNRRWQNEEALWEDTVTHAPRSRVVRLKLGERAEERQDLEGAFRE